MTPWVILAFGAVVVALWLSHPRTSRPKHEPQQPPAPVDTLAQMREQIETMLREVDADTTGRPHGEAIDLILGILRRSPSDSAARAQARVLAARADSLGTALLRSNTLKDASAHLAHAHRVWAALASTSPQDSLLSALRERVARQLEILEVKRAMFADMVPVAAGPFRRGSNQGRLDARPERELMISGFYIDRTEVTNRQYRAFVLDTGAPPPGGSQSRGGWQGTDYPEGAADLPVVSVTWDDAVRFAAWAGKRLPTEAEWEKAARGVDGRSYPWGDDFGVERFVGKGAGGPKPVGSIPSGASPYGALDMVGNVREWTADYYDPDYFGKAPAADPKGPARGRERVVRGGSWRRDCEVEGLTHFRTAEPPGTRADDLGFRLAISESLFTTYAR